MAKDVKLRLGFEGHEREVKVSVKDGEAVPWDLDTEHRVVNTEVPRVDGAEKVTGRAKYTYDVNLPGMLHAAVLRSPHAHAHVRKVDTAIAASMRGVQAVWTIASRRSGSGPWPVLCEGDEVAAVAATTPEIAEDAIEAIEVTYDVQPHVTGLDEAMADGAPKANGRDDNIVVGRGRGGGFERGDVDGAMKKSDVVVEGTWRTQVQTHSCLETHGFVCRFEDDGSLTVWASTQGTFSVQGDLARNLRMPAAKIRVITEHMGGGFGSKFGGRGGADICARLAQAAKAPVKLMCDRRGEHLVGGNRPSSIQHLKLGATKAGKITAIDVVTHGGPGYSGRGGGAQNTVIYDFPAARKTADDIRTNTGAAAAFRAPGFPQGVFALEGAIDMAAHAIGMDPLAFRELNDSDDIRRAERALGAKRIGWERRNGAKPPKGPIARGLGYAAAMWFNVGRGRADVVCEIHDDGRVVVRNGAQDLGTGTRTIMAVLTAEDLGVPVDAITVALGDTRDGVGPASGGSSTAPGLAPAIRNAAVAARTALLETVGAALEIPTADLSIVDGHVVAPGGKKIAWARACSLIEGGKIAGHGARPPNFDAYKQGVSGCQFAEVEVDVQTGVVRVIKVVAVQDCGTPISRLTLESQINGAVIQGVSYALHEERVIDTQTGRMLNPDLLSYKISGSLDMPEIDVVIFDVANGANNAGVAGVGEPPTIPTSGAIANAIFDATGARCYELPMTPKRVLEALDAARGK